MRYNTENDLNDVNSNKIDKQQQKTTWKKQILFVVQSIANSYKTSSKVDTEATKKSKFSFPQFAINVSFGL